MPQAHNDLFWAVPIACFFYSPQGHLFRNWIQYVLNCRFSCSILNIIAGNIVRVFYYSVLSSPNSIRHPNIIF